MATLREKLLKQLMLEFKNIVLFPLAGGLNSDSYWAAFTPHLYQHSAHGFTGCLVCSTGFLPSLDELLYRGVKTTGSELLMRTRTEGRILSRDTLA